MAAFCDVVGNFDISVNGCVISINTSCSTELIYACVDDTNENDILEGPSVFNINMTAYATDYIWAGSPAKAGVTINFIRKYDCVNDELWLIPAGKGQSFIVGDTLDLVTIERELSAVCESVSASSASGPATIYTKTTQRNGYGLSYTGQPFSFATAGSQKTGLELNAGDNLYGYLQSFSFDATPGEYPTVSYSLIRSFNG